MVLLDLWIRHQEIMHHVGLVAVKLEVKGHHRGVRHRRILSDRHPYLLGYFLEDQFFVICQCLRIRIELVRIMEM